MENKKSKEWISLQYERDEKDFIRRTAKEIGLPVSELLRRAARIGIPILRGAPGPGARFERASGECGAS